ncbi:Serine threonine kinase [Perkinsus chesapeaki]|uniref:Serine threonine kinase n=1 Tax=Perkinsus chesapeaki TaxID=330153 RepID=A0A7J6L1R9_PERCH|nr:Serine threonine kinase [Perkinsus chesapeaki]
MNNYHLYEEIGHGKYTVVYKGRKRYSIEYVGIKSTEKCRRSRVMNEVKASAFDSLFPLPVLEASVTKLSLDANEYLGPSVLNDIKGHFNVLKFFNWYETRNHLWIITEYCAGGDLLKVLKQDTKVSPDQCRLFCLDIVSGLHHVHRNGIIYGDLKPSNLLFTEEGRLKLCDFGMSQRLTDLEGLSAKGKPLPRRGTPYYMAPELFLDRGVHSFASDLWALGIVMHELVTGRPPFVSNSFQSLQQLIKENDPNPDITPLSSAMADLVHGRGHRGNDGSLLGKDPATRLDWPGLLRHSFWNGQFDSLLGVDLPMQKHFNDYINTTHRQHYPNNRCHAVTSAAAASTSSSQRLLERSSSMGSGAGGSHTPSSEMLRSETPSAMAHPTPPPPPPPPLSTRQQHGIQQLAFSPSAPSEAGRASLSSAIARLLPHWSDQSVSPISAGQEEEEAMAPDSSNDFINGDDAVDAGRAGKENSRAWENRLPFAVYDRDDFVAAITQSAASAALNKEVHSHISEIYQHLKSATSSELVSSVIAYLNHLSERVEIADVVLNSSILSLLLVLASPGDTTPRGSLGAMARRSEALRIDTLNMLGKALRHASFIEPGCTSAGGGGGHSMTVGASGISYHSADGSSLDTHGSAPGAFGGYGLFETLQHCIEERTGNSLAVRRSALAALGELMFYVATQQSPSTAADTTANSILSGCSSSSSLELPLSVASMVMQTCLVKGDDMEAHGLLMLSAQTLQNIALMAPSGWVPSNLLTPTVARQVLTRLTRVCCDSGVHPRVRITCLTALDKTLSLVPATARLSPTELLRICISGLQLAAKANTEAEVQRAVSSGVSFGMKLLNSHRIDIASADALVTEVLSILSLPRLSGVSRGKVFLLLARLFLLRGSSNDTIGAHALHLALEKNLSMRFDRVCRYVPPDPTGESQDDDTVEYLHRALSIIVDSISICLWQCLAEAVTELHALNVVTPTPSPRCSHRIPRAFNGESHRMAECLLKQSEERHGASAVYVQRHTAAPTVDGHRGHSCPSWCDTRSFKSFSDVTMQLLGDEEM